MLSVLLSLRFSQTNADDEVHAQCILCDICDIQYYLRFLYLVCSILPVCPIVVCNFFFFLEISSLRQILVTSRSAWLRELTELRDICIVFAPSLTSWSISMHFNTILWHSVVWISQLLALTLETKQKVLILNCVSPSVCLSVISSSCLKHSKHFCKLRIYVKLLWYGSRQIHFLVTISRRKCSLSNFISGYEENTRVRWQKRTPVVIIK